MIKIKEQPYLMSFCTGGLFINESLVVAKLHKPNEKWAATSMSAMAKGVFSVRKASSTQRYMQEIVNRLECLSVVELELLQHGHRSEQATLLWLAACRAYRFIQEFAVEVVCEKYLSFQIQLTYVDFDSFYFRKAEWSEKLASLSVSTQVKLRAVLFRMMREADIISEDGQVLAAMLTTRFVALINSQNPSEISCFPGGAHYA